MNASIFRTYIATVVVIVLIYWAWKCARSRKSRWVAIELPMTVKTESTAYHHDGSVMFLADGGLLFCDSNRLFEEGAEIEYAEDHGLQATRDRGFGEVLHIRRPDGVVQSYQFLGLTWYRLVPRKRDQSGILAEVLRQVRHRGVMVIPDFLHSLGRALLAIPAFLIGIAQMGWAIVFGLCLLLALVWPELLDRIPPHPKPTYTPNHEPPPAIVSNFDDDPSDVTFIRDGRTAVACGRSLRFLDVTNRASRERTALAPEFSPTVLKSLSVSPCGTKIAAVADGEVLVWDKLANTWILGRDEPWASHKWPVLLDAPPRIEDTPDFFRPALDVRTLLFSPCATYVVTGGGDGFSGEVRLLRAETLETIASFETLAFVSSVAFSADGNIAAAATGTEYVLILAVPSLRLLATLEPPPEAYPWPTGPGGCTVCFAPMGNRLVCAGRSGWLHLWDVGTGTLEKSVDLGAEATFISFLPSDETRLVVLLPDGGHGQISLVDLTSASLLASLTPSVQSMDAAISPDGSTVAVLGLRQIQIVSVADLLRRIKHNT